MSTEYIIVEEVPGVPPEERFYIEGPGYDPGAPMSFPTKEAAEEHLLAAGITVWVFEPCYNG